MDKEQIAEEREILRIILQQIIFYLGLGVIFVGLILFSIPTTIEFGIFFYSLGFGILLFAFQSAYSKKFSNDQQKFQKILVENTDRLEKLILETKKQNSDFSTELSIIKTKINDYKNYGKFRAIKYESPKKDHQKIIRNPIFIFEKLLQIRDLDNQLMWTRITILLTAQAILFGFIANSYINLLRDNFLILIVILTFGTILSIFFIKITKGGSNWIDWWEAKIREIEKEIQSEDTDFDIFTSQPPKVNYISTRGAMIHVSIFFSLAWICLLLISFLQRAIILNIWK